jgi:nitrous oxidase accessory protein
MRGIFVNAKRYLVVAGLTLAATGLALPARAERISVYPDEVPLQAVISQAEAGDILVLQSGRHLGPISVAKSITIEGADDATIEGNGTGTVITVNAPDVVLRNFQVTGSGLLLETQDSGIFLTPAATNAQVTGLHVVDNLIGVYVSGANNALVSGNRIIGRSDLRLNERGNGVQVWNAPGAVIAENEISAGRDGIFVTTSKRNIFRDNDIHDVRIAVHYMYTNDSQVIGNISRRNQVGYAIMYSSGIKVRDNISENDRDRGMLFNFANGIEIVGNMVSGGPKNCLFIYNSNRNQISGNYIAGCDIGIQFTAGSEQNDIYSNAFVANRTQVKYVGTRWLEWSANGVGNYWSDNSAFDLDRNGIGDAPYRPNDLTDQIIWRYPAAKLLLNSPAIQVLKWAQGAFPALHPGGVIDSFPLMAVPDALAARLGGQS